ncbi:hypothetical protein OIV58_32035, partial [Burkholderia pseudomallei]|nr:hypothetical protein [Burkholderia pseudomallei]
YVGKTTEQPRSPAAAAGRTAVAGYTESRTAKNREVCQPVDGRLVAFEVEEKVVRGRVDRRLEDCLALAARESRRYCVALSEVGPSDDAAPLASGHTLTHAPNPDDVWSAASPKGVLCYIYDPAYVSLDQ